MKCLIKFWLAPLPAMAMAFSVAAPVHVTSSTLDVVSGNTCTLKAIRKDQKTPDWTWQVVEGGGWISPKADGRACYTAPLVDGPTTVHIQVADANQQGEDAVLAINVMPRIQGLPDLVAETLMPKLMGPGWMAQVPAMTLFAGRLEGPWACGEADFRAITSLRFLEADPAMGSLNQKWLLAGAGGLAALSSAGDLEPVPDLTEGIKTLATRPRDSVPENPWHVVCAEANPRAFMDPVGSGRIWALDPGGKVRLIAGAATGPPGRLEDGPGPAAAFGFVTGLAMGMDGTLFVADAGKRAIRKIGPEGTVTTLAGWTDGPLPPMSLEAEDGRGPSARFQDLRDLALDHRFGHLYVVDGNAIRRVTQEGEVETVLGQPKVGAFEEGCRPDQTIPLGAPCLRDPAALQIHGEDLFVADMGNHSIRVFNLRTRVLQTLAGHPTQREVRPGPLRRCSPASPLGACAALENPRLVAINADGICLVALPNGLARIDLDDRRPLGADRPPGAAAPGGDGN